MSRLERDLPPPTPAPCAATWPPGHIRGGRPGPAGRQAVPPGPDHLDPQHPTGPGRLVPLAAARDL